MLGRWAFQLGMTPTRPTSRAWYWTESAYKYLSPSNGGCTAIHKPILELFSADFANNHLVHRSY